MFQRVRSWLGERIQGRPFEAFQIEVTTRCLARCVMCPRVALADHWPEIDLPWETFQRIARAFDLTQHVHLQGWGEPLLHPRLFDMIAAAKGADCRVGLTTNGMRLTPDVTKQLLELDLDLVAISISGATGKIHESIRRGLDFQVILDNVRGLLDSRSREGKQRPKVEFSYLMLRTNMEELPKAVELAASLGVDELYANNLDCVVTADHESLKVFAFPPLREDFGRVVEKAREAACRARLAFRAYPLDPEEVAVCEANPAKILFISADGWVSPCTYLGLAGRKEIPRCFDGREVTVPRMRFGNIKDQELLDVWSDRAYRAFRRRFAERRLGVAARTLAVLASRDASGPRLPPAPEPCRTCYKLYGV